MPRPTGAAQLAPGARRFALEGSVFIGGAVVQWLRDGLKAIEARAALESLAFQSAALLRVMSLETAAAGVPAVAELRVDGGASVTTC